MGKFFPFAEGLGGSRCSRNFWVKLVQECLRRLFLPLQVRGCVGSGVEVGYVLFQVPWSESKKFLI